MKKTICTLLLVLFVFPLFSQFQVSHGTGNAEYGKTVRTLHFDEAYILGGSTSKSISKAIDATLVKTKYNGSIIWAKEYGFDKNETFNSVRPIYPKIDKGYVCFGSTNSIGYGCSDMLFVQTDPNGNPVSVFTYGGKKDDYGHCIQVIENKENNDPVLIMIGNTLSYTGTSKMFILKTKLDGTYLDGAIVGTKGNQHGYWIEQTKDGGYIAVGSSDYACKVNADTSILDIFIVKLKPSLDLEWARTIGGGPDLPFNDIAYSVKEIEKGYLVTGNTNSFGESKTKDAFLLKLDHSGNLIWLRNYGYKKDDGSFDVLSEENSSINHQYILTGFTNFNENKYSMLVATDHDGNITWKKMYGWIGTQQSVEMDKTLKPGYVFTGNERSFGPGLSGIYQVVTDDIGNSNCPICELELPIKSKKHEPCIMKGAFSEPIKTGSRNKIKYWRADYKTYDCGSEIKSTDEESIAKFNNNHEMLIYPNPSNGKLNVDYPNKYLNGYISIYNSLGQKILSKQLNATNSINLSLDSPLPGLYYVIVASKMGERISSSFFIK